MSLPRVRVMQCQGKPLFIVLTNRGMFTAFSWRLLQHKLRTDDKVVNDLKRMTLFKRLGVAGLPALLPAQPSHCDANRDGECTHPGCPQLLHGEPRATGRHCPVPDWPEEG